MNEKEALQNIRNLTKHLDNSDDRLVDTFRLAIIALNKQTPKKPDYEGGSNPNFWICAEITTLKKSQLSFKYADKYGIL